MFRLPGIIIFLMLQIAVLVIGLATKPIVILLAPFILILIWATVTNPGITLILLSLTGVLKGFLFEQVTLFETIDLSLLLILLLMVGWFYLLITDRFHIPKDLRNLAFLFIGLTFVLFVSGFYTVSPEYGWMKIGRFIVFLLPMCLTPFIIFQKSEDSRKLLRIFIIVIICVAAILMIRLVYISLTGGLLGYLVRVTITGANPISIARYLALGGALSFAALLRQSMNMKIIQVLALIIILLGIISTGSRGPLFSLFFSALTFAIIFEQRNFKKIFLFLSGSMLVVIALIYFLPENLTYRFSQITSGEYVLTQTGVRRYSTIASRYNFWILGLSAWISSIKNVFFGLGAGGYSSLFIWRDFRWYPHNIFIEILAELGIVGFSLLVLFFYFSAKFLLKNRKYYALGSSTPYWVSILLVTFFNSLFSGDVNDNRMFFMLLSVSLASSLMDYKKYYTGQKVNSLLTGSMYQNHVKISS
jgi:O-antigen ligase